jgi:hypothetical protein
LTHVSVHQSAISFARVTGGVDDCWWVTLAPAALRELPAASTVDGSSTSPAAKSPEGSRVWIEGNAHAEGEVACASHRGPEKIHADKDNEDFAFSITMESPTNEVWFLAGVCDGVTQSPWSDRGARHVAECFVEVVRSALTKHDLAAAIQTTDGKRQFAEEFRQVLLRRFQADGQDLQVKRAIDPKFGESLFKKAFLDSPTAHLREAWFQTTILATALGPHGGFVLFIGDGYLRVDRKRADGSIQQKELELQRDSKQPERVVSTGLSLQDVLVGIRGLPPDGASEIRVIVATDGVSKSPRHGLDAVRLTDAVSCNTFLEQLAQRPDTEVEPDNMSIAFASRRIAL